MGSSNTDTPERPFTLPPVLCHYTNGDALLQILRDNELRATHIRYLNDATEYRRAIDFLVERLAQESARIRSTNGSDFLAKMIDVFGALHRGWIEAMDEYGLLLVTCFSAIEDDLSQWRGYGGGEAGYCICFDPAALDAAFREQRAYLAQCSYGAPAFEELWQKVSELLLPDLSKITSTNGDVEVKRAAELCFRDVAFRIDTVAPYIKHGAFWAENEWRAVKRVAAGSDWPIETIMKGTTLAPVTRLKLGVPKEAGNSAIREIIVGPTRHQGLSKDALTRHLKRIPHVAHVTVRESAIPFRQF